MQLAILRQMADTIDFDNKLRFDRAKIYGIGRNWILTAKLDSTDLAIPNPLPHGVGELV
jgi:hypothetical protein